MSFDSYSKWWIVTKGKLAKLREREMKQLANNPELNDRPLVTKLVGGLYARYLIIVQEIDTCLDQLAQAQQNQTIRKMLDAALIRVNELKDELLKVELSEYHYIDGNLIELKLIPHSIEILHPTLFISRPLEIQSMWERILKGETIYIPPPPKDEERKKVEALDPMALLKQTKAPKKEEKAPEPSMEEEPPPPPPELTPAPEGEKKKKRYVPEEKVMSPEELEALRLKQIYNTTVTIIQKMERARQSRLYVLDLIRRNMATGQKKKKKKGEEEEEVVTFDDHAAFIQRNWRGFAQRLETKRREQDRRLLIGMTESNYHSNELYEKLEKDGAVRRAKREQRVRDYIEAHLKEKERVLRVIGPGLMEDISDEIREWFYQWYIRARNFDKYPGPDKGGTVLVVRGETFTPEEWIDEVERVRREGVKGGAQAKEKEKKEKERLKKEKDAQKKKEAEILKKEREYVKKLAKTGIGFKFQFKPSTGDPLLMEAFQEHKQWDLRKMEDNPEEIHYMDLIHDEKCYEMQLEIREKVDELMRLELNILLDALAADKWKAKGKKGTAPPRKKGKEKKKKKTKPVKLPYKDITKDRQIEDLFQELWRNKIIRTYPVRRLSDYFGDFSYQNWEKRMLEYDPPATLGDVRQAVALNCIVPLGCSSMNNRPKSVLIAGPRGCGLHFLANAIFTETQCVLFDLSPENIGGTYPGKEGATMLIHLVAKMSRILQPSIIYFDGGEKPFYKKVPKNEQHLEPKRLGAKLFPKLVKTFRPQDRVLLLGVTRQPWAGAAGGMKKCYERNILIPRPDYGSVYLYWRKLLMGYNGVDRDLDVSAITRLTVYYPLPCIKIAVEKVMTPRRIIKLKYQALSLHELLDAILQGDDRINDKEWQKYIKWYQKTTIGKQRRIYQAVVEKRREAAVAAADKDKGKKGK